jgi:HAD superfamily hydrolase (TIGR01509 family)
VAAPKISAVIFDCDGVLVNSEEIYQRVEKQCLDEVGLKFDRDAYDDRFLGVTGEAYFAGLNDDHVEQFGRDLPSGFIERLLALTTAELGRSLTAHDGVPATIAGVAVPKAVASSSSKERLDHKLRHVGIFDAFAPHVYSAEVVGRGKPAPDLYLYTAAKLGVGAAGCVAVEDSVNGVLSARAAGMGVVGYIGGRHCSPRQAAKLRSAGADIVIDHMNLLLGAIADLR